MTSAAINALEQGKRCYIDRQTMCKQPSTFDNPQGDRLSLRHHIH